MNTQDLIDTLSHKTAPAKALKPPLWWGFVLIVILSLYAVGLLSFLGIRDDLAVQLTRPLFVIEFLLLVTLILSSSWASILSMYPDLYQRKFLFNVPYVIFGALALLTLFQIIFMPYDPRMAIPELEGLHGMECAICIAAVSIIPAALLIAVQRQGACVYPMKAGSFAVLAAASLGCLLVRIEEANDSLMHLATWHYLPTLLFAACGAALGRFFLKW